MLQINYIDGEWFYFVFTNKGNNLILVTRDSRLAMLTNAAMKNKKDDSEFRVKAVKKLKAA